MIDTPISEEGFVGAAFGAAWMGERPIAELQFADFVACPFDQIVTVGAKTHWRSGIALPVVIRLPTGGGVRGGPFHASSPEGWFVGVAGLKVVCPGTVDDAYGLLRSAIEDDDPVLYFEHKALYRRLKAPQPEHRCFAPHRPRRASCARAATSTVVTYGSGVTLALEVAEKLAATGVDRGGRPAHDLAGRRRHRARLGRAHLARASCCRRPPRRSASPTPLVSLIAREGFALLDAPIVGGGRARLAGAVRARAGGRLPAVRRRPRSRAGGPPCLLSRAPSIPCDEAPDVPDDVRRELFRCVLVHRLFEERIIALYRQGRIPGSVYTGPRPGGGRRRRRPRARPGRRRSRR